VIIYYISALSNSNSNSSPSMRPYKVRNWVLHKCDASAHSDQQQITFLLTGVTDTHASTTHQQSLCEV